VRIESKEKLAAYFWENPGLKTLPSTLTDLRVYNCPGLTSRGLRVGKLTIEIR
jgi:hypothetical protein